MTRCASLLLILVLAAHASGQDLPPERLDDVYVRHQVLMFSDGNASGTANLWLQSGFGVVEFTDTNRPAVWRIKDATGQPYKYTWFRIRNESNGAMDDHWFCERWVWTNYVANSNLETLKQQSWHFRNFHISSGYTVPEPAIPVTWEHRTDVLTVGYANENTIIVVRKSDGWEWAIRGLYSTEWRPSVSREDAMKEAENYE